MKKTTLRGIVLAVLAGLAALTLLTGCGRQGGDDVAPAQVLAGTLGETPTSVTAPVGEPTHITVGSVGIDAPVLTLPGGAGDINPSTNDDAWWWPDRGTPGSPDTVYLAGHTMDDGSGVFSALHGVTPGETVTLETTAGTRTYRIDATATYSKPQLDHYDEVWSTVPGRLVLVTCHLDDGHPTEDNLLVYATLVA